MAHWIIDKMKNYDRNMYTCSACGGRWDDYNYAVGTWKVCPDCKAIMEEEEKSESKEFAELGKGIAEGFAAGLNDGGFVFISRKEYDEMRDELYSIQERFDNAVKERAHYRDILEMMGFQEKYIDRIVPDSARFVGYERNPVTLNKRVSITFELREN